MRLYGLLGGANTYLCAKHVVNYRDPGVCSAGKI